MVESQLAHKIIYFPETFSRGFHTECGFCLSSFPFWSIRALLTCTALAAAARESLFLINLKVVFNRGFLKENWPLVKHSSFLCLFSSVCIGTLKHICLKECILPFLKKKKEKEKDLLFSISCLAEALPCEPCHRGKKILSSSFFCTSHLVTFSHRKYSQRMQILRVWSQSLWPAMEKIYAGSISEKADHVLPL